ncbi:huntingtin-interacting protein 1-related protein-like isoform X1 [Sinocyclocheilus anshuiensis]|uniref:huntingtin-interacting protein 1-related protein-like isoform X1 n=1 Tax=Sinocyclocheilus anshuiensis TaxID=1608454 RepID=UPI0007B9BC4F|nr:PREDICTED: huntingtin-interacting protein 1-related protein-like isoform X1 [Sinocyclocheilus anshuiensis]
MASKKTESKKNEKTDKSEKALAAEKEQFVKLQLQSITKSITSAEAPIKEKYGRNIILGTHKEGGAVTFWSHAVSLPLSSNAILSWKFCHMVHKLLRDGHPNTLRDSRGHTASIRQMGTLWGNLHDRYGHIVALYAKLLCIKIDFHLKHLEIPPNLETPEQVLDKAITIDINKVFDMTGEVLEYMEAALKLQETVFRQMESSSTSSTTPVGQCRLAPLVLVIQDCGPLYHFLVKLLFKLHSRTPVDSLLGHRERFREQFNGLTQFFERARGMEFFKSIIQIPDLPDEPPNFLRAASFADHVKPVVVQNETYPDFDETDTQLDFGEGNYQMYYGYNQFDPPNDIPEQRETEADTLRKELEVVKPELELIKVEAQRAVVQLKSQVNILESELEDQRTHKQMALVENERLRMEVENLRAQTAVAASIQATAEDAGSRAQTAQIHFTRLKEKHAELVSRHADLMRKNAEMVKQLSSTQQAQEELLTYKQQMAVEVEQPKQDKNSKLEAQRAEIECLKQELASERAEISQVHNALQSKEKAGDGLSSVLVGLQAEKEKLLRTVKDQEAEITSLRQATHLHQTILQQERDRHQREMTALQNQLQEKLCREQELQLEMQKLRRELEEKRAELLRAQSALNSKETTGDQLSSVLVGLQAEKEVLLRSVKEQEAEITNLRQAAQLHQATLLQERDRSQREMTVLQSQMQAKLSQDSGLLLQKLQDEQFSLLQCAVVEAEGIVLDAVAKVDDPLHVRCISTPDYLINRAELTLASIDKMQKSHVAYLRNMDDASGLLRSVTQFSHLIADTIVNGAGTAHSAPTDQADRLTDNCRDCATHCLQYLKELKLKATLPRADPTAVRFVVQHILNQGQDLQPRGADVRKEELADMVDKEMAATSSAIEDAVLRMDEILSQARRDSSGVKLEVNQSIIGSCSDLMKAIHMLVTSATDLQRDIVESGRGAGSVKDFYAKNSCWTEGLISASKAVGWGATQMLESADKVVTDRGKYEELIVCSHEIAASTAQLVAASKVKADRGNKKLQTLQQASRHVNDMAAVLVSSTKSGQMQIENKNSMDFSSMSLIKLKTEEMDSQVKVLELEKQLENERIRLGELRKKHYEMGGIPMDSPPESAVNSFDSSLPTVFPDPPTMELPSLDTFTLDPPRFEPLRQEPPAPESAKTSSKRTSIFHKSGSILKNAFR